MNCNYVQDLLPLYAGRDLDEKLTRLVAEHLQSCAACEHSADEYRETMQMMGQFAPPPFSEAVYAGIRRRVLSEIEAKSTAPTMAQMVAKLFRPRIGRAIAASILFAVATLAIFMVTNRDDRRQVAGGPKADRAAHDESTDVPSHYNESATPSSSSRNTNDGESILARFVPRIHRSPARMHTGAAADRAKSVAHEPDERLIATSVSPEIVKRNEPDIVTFGNPPPGPTLRMEIQTKDPNIRIIWFSQQLAKQDSK